MVFRLSLKKKPGEEVNLYQCNAADGIHRENVSDDIVVTSPQSILITEPVVIVQ